MKVYKTVISYIPYTLDHKNTYINVLRSFCIDLNICDIQNKKYIITRYIIC